MSRIHAGLMILCLLAACAGERPVRAPANGQVGNAPAAPPLDPSYEWHGLVLMPFGTLLKDSPLVLHEVLLFHDDTHKNSAELGNDCFTVDRKPRLAEHEADPFLLCFTHDRLDRIEATAAMKAGEGPAVLARMCGLWLRNSGPPTDGTGCEGREGDVAFSAHLGDGLSVVLTHSPERAAASER